MAKKLSDRQYVLVDAIDDFMRRDEKSLFIRLPRTYFGLAYALVSFMVNYVDPHNEYDKIVYLSASRLKVKSYYTLFREMAKGQKMSRCSADDQGVYHIQFIDEFFSYEFRHADIDVKATPEPQPRILYIYDTLLSSQASRHELRHSKVIWSIHNTYQLNEDLFSVKCV